ncbi:hypothetical protein BV25DRAFT_1922948 [Artomyces pyxidatus]|uniref:Uncharacterized protein n=1 Tax=Artomyces pyxidatus TaxID=48021 RepID=A0ACB8SCK6_9AGAM|nr:hypothetical protein BV25DRAFT_1922948 [Artomyces pyxidatus]
MPVGLLNIEPGDAIFGRTLTGRETGEDDILQALVLASGQLVEFGDGRELVGNFRASRDGMLGPSNARGRERPSMNAETGQLEGGTAFERSGNAHPVQNSRAYTIGLSYEKPTQILAPAVGNKSSPRLPLNSGLRMRQNVMKSSMGLAMHGCEWLPQEYRDRMEEQAELVNAPNLGIDRNPCFFTAQVNLSPAVSAADGSKVKSLLGKRQLAHDVIILIGDAFPIGQKLRLKRPKHLPRPSQSRK